jgi:hypothetical protein
MASSFVIKKRSGDSEATIFSDKQEVAKIVRNKDFSFKLIRLKDKHEWVLTNLVDGERRPFSYTVLNETKNSYNDKNQKVNEVFVVREQLFKYKDEFYMLASHPKEKSWTDYVGNSTRYICRLDNFPYSDMSDVDHGHYILRHKIKRLRGTPVGEASGLALHEDGHRVSLTEEISDIGLFIAAISYLLYASG